VDPITHTLCGVAAAQILPLGEQQALATLTMAVAANLPDLDAVTRRLRSTAFLEYHHAATHSLPGLLGLSLLFAALWAPVTGLSFLQALGLSLLGCLVHTGGDLLIHMFGVPLFFPFSKKEYGANLLIGANPTTSSARCGERSLWVCTRCQLHSASLSPVLILLASCLALGALFGQLRPFSVLALGLLFLYLGLTLLLRRIARRVFLAEASQFRGLRPERFFVYPASFLPFRWLGVGETEDGDYLLGRVDLYRLELPVRFERLPRRSSHLLVKVSENTQTVRAFLTRCFHPCAIAEENDAGVLVRWKDLSYAIDPSIDLFTARVQFSPAGEVLSEEYRERW